MRAPGGGWSIRFPDEPIVHDSFIAPDGKVMYYTSLELLAGANQYLAESYELIAEDSWDLDDSARFYAEALARGGMRASAPKAINFAGRDAREIMLEQGAQTARCIIVVDGKRKFHLLAGGERVNERADHFLRSFQITAPPLTRSCERGRWLHAPALVRSVLF